MRYEIQKTTQFKKDYKRSKKRNYNLNLLKEVVILLVEGKKLPSKYNDHSLSGEYYGYRECHIGPDWLLIYKITQSKNILSLYRIGTHSDLF